MKNRTIHGKRYLLMPALRAGSCYHCVFTKEGSSICKLVDNAPEDDRRYGDSYRIGCNPEDEPEDFIFIKTTKKAMAEYIAHKLEGT